MVTWDDVKENPRIQNILGVLRNIQQDSLERNSNIKDMTEWAQFLAGNIAPAAFLWLLYQQGYTLDEVEGFLRKQI